MALNLFILSFFSLILQMTPHLFACHFFMMKLTKNSNFFFTKKSLTALKTKIFFVDGVSKLFSKVVPLLCDT